jgi:hypothetical protein
MYMLKCDGPPGRAHRSGFERIAAGTIAKIALARRTLTLCYSACAAGETRASSVRGGDRASRRLSG